MRLSTSTNMDDMTLCVNHNVAVVAIFNLQQITNHRVGSHRFYKITARRLELFASLVAVLM